MTQKSQIIQGSRRHTHGTHTRNMMLYLLEGAERHKGKNVSTKALLGRRQALIALATEQNVEGKPEPLLLPVRTFIVHTPFCMV